MPMTLKNFSLRTKLVIVLSLLVSSLATLLLVTLPPRLERQVRRLVEERALLGAQVLAASVASACEFELPDKAVERLSELARAPGVRFARIYDNAGARFAGWQDERHELVASGGEAFLKREGPAISLAGDDLLVWVPIAGLLGRAGTLVLGVSLDILKHERRAATETVVLTAGLLLVFGLGAATALGGLLVRPLRELTSLAKRVADGEPIPSSMIELARRDEIGVMSAALRRMLEKLRELHERVEQRAAAVADTNQRLQASLEQLRVAQEALLHSTRLASVGEMAGRTAHEVLNPMSAVHGRVTKLAHIEREVIAADLDVFGAVIDGWRDAYRSGGSAALMRSLEEVVEDGRGGSTTLLTQDLENLAAFRDLMQARSAERRQGFDFLLREVGRVTRIIDGMRGIARQNATPVLCELNDVIRESCEVVSDGLAKRNITLLEHLDAPATLYLDRYELVQVLTNVLRNGMQAIEEKSGRSGGSIAVATSADQRDVFVRLIDSGVGISPANLGRLFESNFTTRGAQDGTGFGLSLSRRLARGFGGDLEIEESEPGRGTTVLLRLPRADTSKHERKAEVSHAG